MAFRHLEPVTYKKIAKLLDERRLDRLSYIEAVLVVLRQTLAASELQADIAGRPKHIFSIWKKMQKKHLDFSELYDIRAVRILVNTVKDCYAVLGLVHSLWQPVPGEFDDYISHPKGNDYKSLHTAVIGPEDKFIEVQIRTFDMHEHAEFGVAAHWRYKEGGKGDAAYEEKIAWLRQLLDWREDVATPEAETLADAFQTELFSDTIYVMTPAGKVLPLPTGAHQVKLEIQALEYQEWHRGDVVSDVWLNSANFTLPIDFSLFAWLYEVPLIRHCIPIDWEQDAARWRTGELNPATWSQQLLVNQTVVPLIHHWLMIQGQRSMRGVRMNTLGWFDFKSAWFAPPEP